MICTVEMTRDALMQLKAIKDKRVRANLFERIEELSNDPENQGKPLYEELKGLRSVRVIGQRYRIVFKVERKRVVVVVVAVGLRKQGDRHDIYQLAARLIRATQGDFQTEGPTES